MKEYKIVRIEKKVYDKLVKLGSYNQTMSDIINCVLNNGDKKCQK